jgi:hypothetical protein
MCCPSMVSHSRSLSYSVVVLPAVPVPSCRPQPRLAPRSPCSAVQYSPIPIVSLSDIDSSVSHLCSTRSTAVAAALPQPSPAQPGPRATSSTHSPTAALTRR